LIYWGILNVLSVLFFLTRIWAGGDMKLMLWLSLSLSFVFSSFLDVFIYIFLLFLSGVFVVFIYALYYFIKEFRKIKEDVKLFAKKYLFLVPLAFIFFLINFYIPIFLLFFYFSLIVVKSVDKLFYFERKVDELVEGDWICEKIEKNGKVIYSPEVKIIFETNKVKILIFILSSSLVLFSFFYFKNPLILLSIFPIFFLSFVSLKGICVTREIIEMLKKEGIEKVKIKEGAPFVPSFLISYILLLLIKHKVIQINLLTIAANI